MHHTSPMIAHNIAHGIPVSCISFYRTSPLSLACAACFNVCDCRGNSTFSSLPLLSGLYNVHLKSGNLAQIHVSDWASVFTYSTSYQIQNLCSLSWLLNPVYWKCDLHSLFQSHGAKHGTHTIVKFTWSSSAITHKVNSKPSMLGCEITYYTPETQTPMNKTLP